TVGGLVGDRGARLLGLKVRRETAALDDEAWNNAVKDRAVEMAVIDVAQKVLRGYRRLLLEELDREVPVGGVELDHGCLKCAAVTVRPTALRSCARARRDRVASVRDGSRARQARVRPHRPAS